MKTFLASSFFACFTTGAAAVADDDASPLSFPAVGEECAFGSDFDANLEVTSYDAGVACPFGITIGRKAIGNDLVAEGAGTESTTARRNYAVWKTEDEDMSLLCINDIEWTRDVASLEDGGTNNILTGSNWIQISPEDPIGENITLVKGPGFYLMDGGTFEYQSNADGAWTGISKAEGTFTDLCAILESNDEWDRDSPEAPSKSSSNYIVGDYDQPCHSSEGGECGSDGYEAYYCRNFTALCEECRRKQPLPFVCERESYTERCDEDFVCSRCFNCEWPEACPPRCNCTSHGDCERGEFCPKDQRECLPCERCDANSKYDRPLDDDDAIADYDSVVPLGDACPSDCFCIASDECNLNNYCSRTYEPPRCVPCNSREAPCKDSDVFDGRKCTDVCSALITCSSATDCAPDEWCWSYDEYSWEFGSYCREIYDGSTDLTCWKLSSWGLKGDGDASQSSAIPAPTPSAPVIVDGYGHDEYIPDGLSYGCPQSICEKWSSDYFIQEYYDPGYFSRWYIPLCGEKSASIYKAGWLKGDKSSLAVEEFSQRSNACTITRYEPPNDEEGEYWPNAVIAVDCTEDIPTDPCDTVDRTVAIWTESPALQYWDSTHPVYIRRIGGYDSCTLRMLPKMFGGIAGAVLGFLLIVGVLLSLRCRFQRARRQRNAETDGNLANPESAS